MKKVLLFVLCCGIISLTQHSFAGNSTSAVAVLKIAPGARPTAMGEAFTAVADDVNAVWFNPAGIGQIKTKQALFTHIAWFGGTNYEYVAGVYPMDKVGTIGVQLGLIDHGSLVGLTSNGAETGETLKASDMIVGAYYSRKLTKEGLLVGVGGKYISETLGDKSGTALGIDAGVIYPVTKEIGLGAAVQNLGISKIKFDTEEDPLPMTIRAGAKYKLSKDMVIAADYVLPTDHSGYINPGIEYLMAMDDMTIGIRGGYKVGGDVAGSGISAGAGILYKMDTMTVGADVAYLNNGDFGNVLRFSVLVKM